MSYFIEGSDDKQNRERLPDPGVFQFTVGQIVTFFHDDFETDKGWTGVHTATAGRFHRADPQRLLGLNIAALSSAMCGDRI